MLKHKPVALAALAAVAALSACDDGPKIVAAKWASQPSADEVLRAYPDFARMARIPGRVRVGCNYTLEGTLERCRILAVAPAGLHFEDALPKLLSRYTVTPQTLDGRPAPSRINFTIAFDPAPAPPPYTGPAPTPAELTAARRGIELIERFRGRSAQYEASRSVDLDRMTAVAEIVDRVYLAEGENLTRARTIAQVQIQTPGERRDAPSQTVFMVSNPDMLARISPEYYAATERAAGLMRTDYCARFPCDARLPETAQAD